LRGGIREGGGVKRFCGVFLGFLMCGLMACGEEVKDREEDGGAVESLVIQRLKGVLAVSGEGNPLESFAYHGFKDDAVVQKELLEVFRERHPKVLAEALKSSGNMHNPKVLPLRGVFAECLMKTPTVARMNEVLSERGFRVSGIDFEKFEIDKEKEGPRFFSFVWVQVEKIEVSEKSVEGER
jgi:hypothetical protein